MKPSAAGLSASERKAREEEMAAKRQKKEAERQRILAQAEADRRARMEPAVPVLAPPAPPAPAASAAANSNVRLQLRCPQWSRNVIFTAFQSNNTLGDVRRALREDLVRGVAGTGDGRMQDTTLADAQVPQEEAIVLAEQVPPRRKFLTAEDMQMTLQAAGLCPSGTLLVDAAPIKVAPPPRPPPPDPTDPAAMEIPSEDDVLEPAEPDAPAPDDGDDDSNGDDGNDDTDDGSDIFSDGFGNGALPKGFGKGGLPKGFGKGGFGKGGTGSGSFGGKWGPGPMFPDDGGQVLGAPSAPSFPTSGGQSTGATSTPEEQKAAREARLAALERRMGGPANQDSRPAEAAEKASSAGPMVMPSQETGRIKGQLGTGPNKAERAREREAILKQLEEDRMRYEERHVAASAVQNEAAKASSSSSAQVRLQIRCASSGRAVTLGSSFTPTDTLLTIRDFAAKELKLLPGEGLEGPEMSLAFPPRTVFNEIAQLRSSLKDLGLTPSATLLIKGVSAEAPAAPVEAPVEEPGEVPGAVEEPEAVEQAAAPCPRNHPMVCVPIEEEMWCDRCSKALPIGSTAWNCHACDYIQCQGCGE